MSTITTASAAPIQKELCRVYVKSVQGGVIRTLFETLKDIVHDSNLIFGHDGAKLATMDAAKCSLVHLKLRSESFEEYFCADTTHVGLNMASIYKLVRTCGTHDTIVLYVLHDFPDELGIRIENAEKNWRTDFKLKLLDADDRNISLPDMEFDSINTLPSSMFQRLCRDMLNLSTTMTIISKKSSLTFSCEGDFARQTTTIGETDEGLVMESNHDTEISSKYSLKYLTLFCKASSLCNTVSLFIKENHPLVVRYSVAGLGDLSFMLSPLIDDVEL
jgi:proliferating cell nuclear antigen